MRNTSCPAILMLLLLFSSCSVKTYRINEKSLTTLDPESKRRYVDVAGIAALPAGEAIFQVEADSLFIEKDKELRLKTGWTLRGKSGKETLIKEQSGTTSAIRIQDADDIVLQDLGIITSGLYTPAKSNALVLIDNEAGKNLQGIEISRMRLSDHFSGITVRRGDNVRIEDCHLYDNAHQIYLGELDVDSAEIYQYRVDNVQILRTKITDGKKADNTSLDGIKTRSNCTNILISGCRIERNWGDAIDLYPGGLDVEIINNDLSYNSIHGVEVKMSDSFQVEQTGQIEHVLIYGNRIVKNGNNGIRVYDDSLNVNYARGIEIDSNRVDSSGFYGIETSLPVIISRNSLRKNGLKAKETGASYSGLSLLNIVRNGKLEVTKNQVIDQAPISVTSDTYWITLNRIANPFILSENELCVSNEYPDRSNVEYYGISLIKIAYPQLIDSLRKNNTFSSKFKCRIVNERQLCSY